MIGNGGKMNNNVFFAWTKEIKINRIYFKISGLFLVATDGREWSDLKKIYLPMEQLMMMFLSQKKTGYSNS
jgi:hypothetical protein